MVSSLYTFDKQERHPALPREPVNIKYLKMSDKYEQ